MEVPSRTYLNLPRRNAGLRYGQGFGFGRNNPGASPY